MRKLIYIEENFISSDECQKLIDLSLANKDKGKDFLTNVTISDPNANLDYVGVVRWPIGTFMKPHVDDNNVHNPDMFAAMLYLNNNFSGGHTCFENFEVKPEPGKLIIFSNSHYLHYVNKVESAERFVLSFWYNSLNK